MTEKKKVKPKPDKCVKRGIGGQEGDGEGIASQQKGSMEVRLLSIILTSFMVTTLEPGITMTGLVPVPS